MFKGKVLLYCESKVWRENWWSYTGLLDVKVHGKIHPWILFYCDAHFKLFSDKLFQYESSLNVAAAFWEMCLPTAFRINWSSSIQRSSGIHTVILHVSEMSRLLYQALLSSLSPCMLPVHSRFSMMERVVLSDSCSCTINVLTDGVICDRPCIHRDNRSTVCSSRRVSGGGVSFEAVMERSWHPAQLCVSFYSDVSVSLWDVLLD